VFFIHPVYSYIYIYIICRIIASVGFDVKKRHDLKLFDIYLVVHTTFIGLKQLTNSTLSLNVHAQKYFQFPII
jgi:hypothetical protein